jgi:hypothetical protein
MNWGIDSEQISMLIDPEASYPHYFHFTTDNVVNGQLTVNFNL